jgi:hypothetical protein
MLKPMVGSKQNNNEYIMKKNYTSALVIDARTRKTTAFVASVTQAQDDNSFQLVLRHALDMGSIQKLVKPAPLQGGGSWDGPVSYPETGMFTTDMPVIIMGSYSAMSSAGHVSTFYRGGEEVRDGYRKVVIVGGLGTPFAKKGGLRVLGRPISAVLINGPVEIEEVRGAHSSNCASADATWAGVKLLASIDSKSVFLMEGQSDYTWVVRLHCKELGIESEFPAEHRTEMFSRESIVRKAVFSAAYNTFPKDGEKPTEEQPSSYPSSRTLDIST